MIENYIVFIFFLDNLCFLFRDFCVNFTLECNCQIEIF